MIHAPVAGQLASVGLGDCAAVAFELSQPARKIRAYRGQRNMPGWWWSSTTGGHVVYQSWLERHHLMEFDRLPQVVGISGQPFALSWTDALRRHQHIPGLFVRFADGSAVVVDCRPIAGADEKFHGVAAVTRAICDQIGWEYRLAGEPTPTRAANLTWLAGYRRSCAGGEQTVGSLTQIASEPVPLLQGAEAVGDPVVVLPTVFHLLWTGVLRCDLDLPLTDHTMMWTERG
ncbi:MAG: TnsA-like heteromeric transposase endonuclease subunit [Actinomycetota bacterium]|nr:TnsA-like heteromeric transposase endonuclease subunit [Actinomycetota bacterium]